jgi:hypothetical protein
VITSTVTGPDPLQCSHCRTPAALTTSSTVRAPAGVGLVVGVAVASGVEVGDVEAGDVEAGSVGDATTALPDVEAVPDDVVATPSPAEQPLSTSAAAATATVGGPRRTHAQPCRRAATRITSSL